ncbi:hypothetical protein AU191_08840 [Mycolicibacterium acapulense]|nr:hypothetical protein AU191_08840 [Mycolicibacterium acapulense]
MQQHGKLVRDRIPEIIEASGRTARVRMLQGDELFNALLAKLHEESDELRTAPIDDRVEELADILEVVYALAAYVGVDNASLRRVADAKRKQRGGFTRGLWLLTQAEGH